MIALYPGSFDPPHLGHLDLIRRAAAGVSHLLVGVAVNPDKRPFLSALERIELLSAECADLANVAVTSYQGQTVAYARSQGATILVRGLRNLADLEAERGLATINREVGGLETWFLLAASAHLHISSDLVRKALAAGMAVDRLVPPRVAARLARLA